MTGSSCTTGIPTSRLASGICCLLLLQQTQAFQISTLPKVASSKTTGKHSYAAVQIPYSGSFASQQWRPFKIQRQVTMPSARLQSTHLSMGFSLPPGRGGGNNNNELGDILKGVAGLALVIGFFASPLGGIVFGIFNSFLLLTLILPVIATIAFQGWQYFNTFTGDCPNCSAPVKVLKANKDGDAPPTICYSCGAIIQANYDNTAIDNVTGRSTVDDLSSRGASVFDIFGGDPSTMGGTTITTTTTIVDEVVTRKDKIRREGTVIDVEVEENDKPFQ